MKIQIKIIKGTNCPRGHKVGDKFIVENGKTPKELCGSAFSSLWPFIRTLMITKRKKEECSIICPDGRLEYELKIIK